jgi:predicted RNA-binding Zn-ribbon protein involved in translation (DUF1610 family)
MAKETQLQKSFKEADISRIRNIIEGKYGEKSKTQIGFDKKEEKHIEGDIWEENGKKWTIKNGIKQTITKLDSIKELTKFPLKCPNCGKAMKYNSYNKKMYAIHKKCFDCVIEYETKLKLEGKFEEYEKNLLNLNRNSHLDEFELSLDEYSKSMNETYMTEQGDKEKWIGGGVDNEWIEVMKDYIREEKSKTI